MTIAVKDDRVLGLVAADTDESFEDPQRSSTKSLGNGKVFPGEIMKGTERESPKESLQEPHGESAGESVRVRSMSDGVSHSSMVWRRSGAASARIIQGFLA